MGQGKTYVGVNGTARKVFRTYIGVSNTARKVKKVYAGDSNNVARLVFSDGWYTANGAIAESYILGAYNFAGAASDNEALTNLVNASMYKLVNNGCSRNANGFLINIGSNQHLNNDTLQAAGIKSVVLKISSCSASAALPLCKVGSGNGPAVWMRTPFNTQSFTYRQHNRIGVTHENGLSVDYVNPPYATGDKPRSYVRIGSTTYSDGVIGFSMDSYASGEKLYRNGIEISLANATWTDNRPWTGSICIKVPRLIGGYFDKNANGSNPDRWDYLGKHSFAGSFRVENAAFYSKKLSQAEHAAIAAALNA